MMVKFMEMIRHVLDVFEKQPIPESSDWNKIEKRYPKFLSKYKLINLQFNDMHFRETFMIQLLVLFQSLKQPINIMQKKYFKVPDRKEMAKIRSKINKILTHTYNYDLKKDKEDKQSEASDVSSNYMEGESFQVSNFQ
jgi:hypothetical protein